MDELVCKGVRPRTAQTGNERVVCIDRMEVKEGTIKILGLTTSPQKVPSGVASAGK